MKRVILILLVLAFAKAVTAQTLIDTGIPDIHFSKFDLSERVDSVWSHEYVMEVGKPMLQNCTVQTFNDNGYLSSCNYTYLYQNKEVTDYRTFVYERNTLKEVRKGAALEEQKSFITYDLDEKNRIVSRPKYKYNYNQEGRLASVVHDEVITEKTVFFSYDGRGNLIENKISVYGKMSGNEVSNTYILYYLNQPFAKVDFVNFKVVVYNEKYGTMTKDFTIETIGEIYNYLKMARDYARQARNAVGLPYDYYIKDYEGWQVTDQYLYNYGVDWTIQVHKSKRLYQDNKMTYTFRKIKYKDGTFKGGTAALEEVINKQTTNFNLPE